MGELLNEKEPVGQGRKPFAGEEGEPERVSRTRPSPKGVRHGWTVEEPPQDVFLSSDPHLSMVHADMGAWLKAHPCDCHAVCRCDDELPSDDEEW